MIDGSICSIVEKNTWVEYQLDEEVEQQAMRKDCVHANPTRVKEETL